MLRKESLIFIFIFSFVHAQFNPTHLAAPNYGKDFPIAIGNITIKGDQSVSIPNFLFKGTALSINKKNNLLTIDQLINSNTQHRGLFSNISDAKLDPKSPITIKASLQATDYVTISIQYDVGTDSTGIISRLLTFNIKTPPSIPGGDCYVQCNVQQLLHDLANSVINPFSLKSSREQLKQNLDPIIDFQFKWVLLNLEFDAYGTYFVVDSVDIYYVYKPASNPNNPISATKHFDHSVVPTIWNDQSVFTRTCSTPEEIEKATEGIPK